MGIHTISSSEFNRDSGAAKRASENGPVVITDRGNPSHVLLTWAEFQRLEGKHQTIAEALAMPGMEDIDFDPPKIDFKPSIPDFD